LIAGRRAVTGLAIAGVVLIVAGALIVALGDRGGDDDVGGDEARSTTTTAASGTASSVVPEGFGSVRVTIEPASGPPRETCMWEAASEAQRARGLMEVTDPDLGGRDGMVFVYETDAGGGFWMRNTPMPLSIAYLDAGGRLVSTADMAPCGDSPSCPAYPAGGPYRYAVEVRQGGLDDLGITGSARVTVGGSC
jgi:uncharacterized membrane protein (UPF0127 family)